ncbi:hypothetical protein HHK36_021023 [Tetracentron sinense]|uniref:Small auxin up regulated protein n=1 Tax=Tetracentron sinense TaxID=13715 RepID=A0A834YT57_TETSI|nr:hypothetical protein HHK36_021023 [Tetracentron sinense]
MKSYKVVSLNLGILTQVWQIIRTKDFLRLLQTPLHHKALIFSRKKGNLKGSGENSKEWLLGGGLSDAPAEVPRGFLAVYVGPKLRRFVIPTSYLSMPDFRVLMERVAEEFGFEQEGGLRIPCEEEDFEEMLRCLAMHQKMKKNKKTRT